MTIKRVSMKEQVYEIIKKRILSGEYALGEQINIVHLTQEFGVSNTPIREALSQLETEWLITVKSNKKYHVTELNQKNIDDLCTVVLIHLLGAFRICRENENIPILISMLKEAFKKQKMLYDTEVSSDYVSASLAFERSFILAANNPMLVRTFDVVMTILTLSITYDQISHRERNIEEHRIILETLEAGNIEKTKELLRKHYNKHMELLA